MRTAIALSMKDNSVDVDVLCAGINILNLWCKKNNLNVEIIYKKCDGDKFGIGISDERP